MVDNYAVTKSHNFEKKWLNGMAISPNTVLNEKQEDIKFCLQWEYKMV